MTRSTANIAIVLAASAFFLILTGGLASAELPDDRCTIPYTTRPEPVTVVIDVSRTYAPINKLLYGHFIENLANWFEGGVWAEMLGDRKFFYPVNNNEELSPPNSRRGFVGSWFRGFVGRWFPIGEERFVVMGKGHPYVGEQSPRIQLDSVEVRGIRQAGLALERGEGYAGRVILAGHPGADIEVTLIWGEGVKDRVSVAISRLSPEYDTYPFSFTVPVDAQDARLEITGTGSEFFWIGAVSLMPEDNIEGFRPDLIALLREMNPTMLRWGGNFSSGYEWRDGIGDRDKRPPRYDFAWGALEPNDMGTFEVLALNRLVGSEPNIGVNAGLGDAYSAAQWVEYVNGSVDTPMGRLRARHGHAKPFNVKWWGIGNEMYGEWQLGRMKIEHYVIKHNRFAKAMREVDPSIILVASGASPFEMGTVSRNFRKPLYSKRPFEYGSPEDWSGRLLEGSGEYFDYLSEHFYHLEDSAFDVEKQEFVRMKDPLIDQLRRAPNRVRAVVEAWEEYNRRFPWLQDSGIKIVLDEWPARGTDLVRAMAAAETMNELFRYTDVFTMSAFTCATCALRYDKTHSTLNGAGLLFKMYTEHFGTIPVDVSGNAPQREVSGTVGVDKPRISSGSDTYPLDVVAALTTDRTKLTIAVVNPTGNEQEIALDLKGGSLPSAGRKWILTGPLDANNAPGEDPVVKITESTMSSVSKTLTIDPMSITVFEFELR